MLPANPECDCCADTRVNAGLNCVAIHDLGYRRRLGACLQQPSQHLGAVACRAAGARIGDIGQHVDATRLAGQRVVDCCRNRCRMDRELLAPIPTHLSELIRVALGKRAISIGNDDRRDSGEWHIGKGESAEYCCGEDSGFLLHVSCAIDRILER